jgi:hypothetical protein
MRKAGLKRTRHQSVDDYLPDSHSGRLILVVRPEDFLIGKRKKNHVAEARQ